MRPSTLILTCLAVAAPLCACHAPAKITVNIPGDYKGNVVIGCSSVRAESVSITTDKWGNGTAASCPTKGSRVFVVRNGETSQVGETNWSTTGDGITTGFSFEAQ